MSGDFDLGFLWWSNFTFNYGFGFQQLWQQDNGDKIITVLHSTLPPLLPEVLKMWICIALHHPSFFVDNFSIFATYILNDILVYDLCHFNSVMLDKRYFWVLPSSIYEVQDLSTAVKNKPTGSKNVTAKNTQKLLGVQWVIWDLFFSLFFSWSSRKSSVKKTVILNKFNKCTTFWKSNVE